MRRHIRILAWMFLAFAAFWAGLAAWFLWVGGLSDALGMAFAFWLTVAAVPLLIAGVGLLNVQPWARLFALVLAALALLAFPIGTAFGVYAFWVLVPDASKAIFSPEISRD